MQIPTGLLVQIRHNRDRNIPTIQALESALNKPYDAKTNKVSVDRELLTQILARLLFANAVNDKIIERTETQALSE